MLMHDDKKKQATLIVAGLKGPKEAPMSEDGAETDNSMAEETAAEDLMAAIESKSPKAIVEAFKNMMECCSGESEPESEPEYESEMPE